MESIATVKDLVKILINKGIKDTKVLEAIARLDRSIFLAKDFKRYANEDRAMPIAYGQTISQPYTVAFMTENLEIKNGDIVLEIGTGSGYQACVLYLMGCKVYTIERIKELYEFSQSIFKSLNINVNGICNDGSKDFFPDITFDKIIITAGAPKVPKYLFDKLNVGGKLIAPVGGKEFQILELYNKTDKSITKKQLGKFRFVPLIGENGWEN